MTTTFTIGDVEFDTTATPTAIVSGYTKAQRAALNGDTLIKVRNLATKTNLVAPLTKGLQVSTYKPSDMKDPNNFFNFVSQWETVILTMESHFSTFYLGSCFTLFRKQETTIEPDIMIVYQAELMDFLKESKANGGDALSYVDPGTDATIYRPTIPTGTMSIVDGGNILRDWHSMSLNDVIESVRIQLKFVSDDVHRQNLTWTYDYIMDCLDADLKVFVMSKTSSLPADVARTGPVAFMVVAQRIIQTTENLAQKVINGLIALRLTDFEAENVVEAIFTVRNVLKFLRYGETTTFAPRTTLVLVYDVFRGSSVAVFRNYIQQAQDIILANETDVEVIFDHLQKKYEELLLADRWVPTKKRTSAFVLGDPKTRTYAEHDNGKGKKDDKDDTNKDTKKKTRKTHDKSGRKIDYTPPKNGAPHKRTRDDGVEEFWCGKCGRWGSHPSSKHDEWKAEMKAKFNKKKESSSNDTSAAAQTPTRTSGSVTFASVVSGNRRFAVDPELEDGIDL